MTLKIGIPDMAAIGRERLLRFLVAGVATGLQLA